VPIRFLLSFFQTDLDDVTVFLLHPAFIHFNETTVGIDVVNFTLIIVLFKNW